MSSRGSIVNAEILPQEPASFWSTVPGTLVFGGGSFLFVSWFIVGPAIMLGLMFNSPNFAPVASILGALVWMISYPIFLSKVYYPGRPWVPILDEQGRPQVQEHDGVQWVWAKKDSGLLRWQRSWVPIEEFPTEDEEGRLVTREERRRQQAEYFRRLQRQEAIAELSPQDFETFVGQWFAAQGYSIEQTPYTADQGVDVRISRANERAVVQCKHSPSGRIGRPVLQQLYAQMIDEHADRAWQTD